MEGFENTEMNLEMVPSLKEFRSKGDRLNSLRNASMRPKEWVTSEHVKKHLEEVVKEVICEILQ